MIQKQRFLQFYCNKYRRYILLKILFVIVVKIGLSQSVELLVLNHFKVIAKVKIDQEVFP